MVPSSWLTAPRVRRLLDVLATLPARSPGLAEANAKLSIWRSCGGPIDEVHTLVDVLLYVGLVTRDHGALRLTRDGERARAMRRSQGQRPLVLAMLRSGLFHDQARRLLEAATPDEDGRLTCRLHDARRAGAQLVGSLQAWPEVRTRPELVIPPDLVEELSTAWALLPPPPVERGEAETTKKSIGDRAELYSYQLERSRTHRLSAIVWVSRDDENLGYDIEDRSVAPRRLIEVKGSSETAVRFFLSDNEWRKAHENRDRYEVHFWGGINLHRDVGDEFHLLRGMGYPLIYRDIPEVIANEGLLATPWKWKVVESGSGTTSNDP